MPVVQTCFYFCSYFSKYLEWKTTARVFGTKSNLILAAIWDKLRIPL